jgi:hypothetical protein
MKHNELTKGYPCIRIGHAFCPRIEEPKLGIPPALHRGVPRRTPTSGVIASLDVRRPLTIGLP